MAVINAKSAAITTAPALISFIWPAFSLYPGETRSVRLSIMVLNISVTKTNAILKATHNHSFVEICNKYPAKMANTVAAKCILKLSWVVVAYATPLKA